MNLQPDAAAPSKPIWPLKLFSPQSIFQGQLSQNILQGIVIEPNPIFSRGRNRPRTDENRPKSYSSLMKLPISSLSVHLDQIASQGKPPRCPSTWRQQAEPGWWAQDGSLCLEHPAQTSSCPLPGREACASDGKPASPRESLTVEQWMLSKVLATCEGGGLRDTARPFRGAFHIEPTGESHSPISLQQCSWSRKRYPRASEAGWYLTVSSSTSGSDPPIINGRQRSGSLLSLDTVKQADQERKGKT